MREYFLAIIYAFGYYTLKKFAIAGRRMIEEICLVLCATPQMNILVMSYSSLNVA